MVECKALADNRMRGIKQAFSLSVLFLVSLASGQNDSVSDTGIVQGTPVQTTQLMETSVQTTQLMETPVQTTQLMETSVQTTQLMETPVQTTTLIMEMPVQTTTQIMATPEPTPTMIDENPAPTTSSTVVMPTQTPDQNNRFSSTPALPDWAIFLIVFGGVVIIAVLASSVGIFVRIAHQRYAKNY